MVQIISAALELFARAGGGGSGGGGGDGDGISFLALIGYVPAHGLGAFLRRKLPSESGAASLLAHVITWPLAIIWAIACFAMFGGGFFGFIVALGAIIGAPAGLFNWFSEVLKQSADVKRRLKRAAANDPMWDEAQLVDFAKQAFMRYQYDWSRQDTESMKQYMTEGYHYHASLFIYTLQLMQRTNTMEDIVIDEAVVMQVHDDQNDANDRVTIGITARAKDTLINTAANAAIFTDNSSFTEYWTFARSGSTWLLADIGQATADMDAYNNELAAFAARNKYCYSVDMGWLFIPERGQLFGQAKFGVSDINNHAVGLYKESLLVQLYTYAAFNGAQPRVIAQVNVPKTYGNIIVHRKQSSNINTRGLERIETEWIQFNQQYEVYASNAEQATSFELLNPTYMEQLAALPFAVTIEVVDNVIYLYTDERGTDVATYGIMLDLVHKAFKELRL
ncbi:MAG: TIM44-like domain-containing protein [Candidatus Saccharimonas sp.]